MRKKIKKLNPITLLRKANISPTMQRVEVLRYLLLNETHPTVDIIYQAIRKEIPTLSKTTVYNILKLFKKHNLAFPIPTNEDEKHYDQALINHKHFICNNCNKIYDIDSSKIEVENTIRDHKIEYYDIVFYGICKKCKKK